MVVEDVLDLGLRELLAVVELDDVEPATTLLAVVQLEYKVVEEDVPADHVV